MSARFFSEALVPSLIRSRQSAQPVAWREGIALVAGVLLMSFLAQVAIPIPGTPVPVTGQTLGVALVGLSWGAQRGFAVMALYLLIGAVGFPVFADGRSGLVFGPTVGYLFGMVAAASVEGYLADRGWTRRFLGSLAACYLGSAIIFSCGLIGLSYFVPADRLLAAGFFPFLIGDTLKNLTAAGLRTAAGKALKRFLSA